ncbi:MAG: AsmA family protein [Verrucomicrobiota bacterium]|jgi:uncharacterized protein involved in outer membrane biogenesis
MKKLITRLLIALVVVVILAVLAVGLFLDGAIKKGVETFGPKLTKVDIKLQSVSLSLFSGSGGIKGLVVGNPEGFKTPSAISVGTATVALKPGSLLSHKIVIKSIKVQGPEITYETDLKHNNLSKILSNVQEATGGGGQEPAKPTEPAPPKEAKPAKTLEVDDFVISGGRIHVSVTTLGGQAATIPLPDIHLQGLGTGPEGITPAELTKRVLEAIKDSVQKASSGAVNDIGKGAIYFTKDAGGLGTNAVDKVTKGLGGFLKKN